MTNRSESRAKGPTRARAFERAVGSPPGDFQRLHGWLRTGGRGLSTECPNARRSRQCARGYSCETGASASGLGDTFPARRGPGAQRGPLARLHFTGLPWFVSGSGALVRDEGRVAPRGCARSKAPSCVHRGTTGREVRGGAWSESTRLRCSEGCRLRAGAVALGAMNE